MYTILRYCRVYCKYHYLEGHEYKNPEEELAHFLKKLAEPNWKWSEQYEIEPFYEHEEIQDKTERKIFFIFFIFVHFVFSLIF